MERRSGLVCLVLAAVVTAVSSAAGWNSSDATSLALAPADAVRDAGPAAAVLHDYGEMQLVRFRGGLPESIAVRVHELKLSNAVGFRGWSGVLAPVGDTAPTARLLVIGLIGPMDPRWRPRLEAAGMRILAPAHPAALVVVAEPGALDRASRIATSAGLSVVRGAAELPAEARVHRTLVGLLHGDEPPAGMALRPVGWHGSALPASVKRALGDGVVFRPRAGELGRLLDEHPEIAYVEPAFAKEAHNNLAARNELLGVEEVWNLGYPYGGDGVTVLHNDAGVDLEHPGLAGAVVAAVGRMEYADTAHGTHTAGSILGRAIDPAPINSSACGDVIQGLPVVTGMAPGAALVTNNVFDGGIGEIPEMMAWGARHGAALSNNSWGLIGQTGPEVGYSAAAVEVDAAVRDADPGTAGPQPMTILFSAGNTGPDPGTVTSPGTAKNAITIGAVENARCGAWVPGRQAGPDPDEVVSSSGRGPSQDRIKPDLVAPGSDVLSLESQDTYAVQLWDQDWTGPLLALNTGTSQACALATGSATLMHEVLWRSNGRRPSPALLKAILIATADGSGTAFDLDRGWGRIDLVAAVRTGLPPLTLDQDSIDPLTAGGRWSTRLAVGSQQRPLVLAVVWTDAPGEADADHPLVNDLDLVVTSPSGRVYRGNVFDDAWSRPDPGGQRDADNNVEVVRVASPVPGSWLVEVAAVDVPEPPAGLAGQDFAVAVVGDAGLCADPPPPPPAVLANPEGPNAIRLSWSPVSGATRYQVARATRPGGQPYEIVATVSAGVTSIVDDGLSGGTTYYYVVRAERLCWSGDSYEVYATATGPCTDLPIFEGVSSVGGVSSAGCALSLEWQPALATCPSVVAYDIYRGEQPDFVPSDEDRVVEDLISNHWTDRGLEPDREYFYVVRASYTDRLDDDGNTVRRGAQPTGPDDVYLDPIVAEFLSTWVLEPGSSSDSGTEVWRRTDDDAWQGNRSWLVDDEDQVKDQVLRLRDPIELAVGAPPLLEFHHRFRLDRGRDGGRLEYSTNGGRDWFDILSGDGQTVPDDPARVLSGGYTDTIAAQANPLYLEDAWSGDSEGWVHTVVDMADFAGRRLLLRWRFGCDDTPGDGWGWWLDAIRLYVERVCASCIPPEPPPWLASSATGQGVELSWPEVPGVPAYRVDRRTRLAGPAEEIAVVAAPMTTHLDAAVSGGTTYYYTVRSDDGCVSDESGVTTVTAEGPCTRAPDFWGLDAVTDRREPGCALDLEWRPAAPGCAGAGVHYRVYRSPTPGFAPGPESVIADFVAGPRYRDLTVADGELVHYRVRAVDGASGVEEANPVERSGWTTGPEEVHFSDSVEGGLGSWRTGVGSGQDSGTEPWQVVDDAAFSGARSWFCSDEPRIKDQVVRLAETFDIVDDSTVLGFRHLYDLEPFWDGGRLEYSTDGGASWHDILAGDGATVGDNQTRFLRGGYSGFVSVGTGHPFGGEPAWTGFDDGWTETVVDLADFVGLGVEFRWRLGCDRGDARTGWWLDDVELRTTSACVAVEPPPPRTAGARRP